MAVTYPEEIYNVTMTHLNEVASIIKGSDAERLVNDAASSL